MGDLRHSVCGSRPLNRDGRTDCPYVDEIRTARFLGDPLPVAHSVVLTLSSTQQTWGLMDAAAIGRPRCFVTEPLPDESPLWQLPTCYSARTPPGAPNGWMKQMVTLFIENSRRDLAGAELLNADPPTGTADSQR